MNTINISFTVIEGLQESYNIAKVVVEETE